MFQPQVRPVATSVDTSPLLRSIAVELRERTREVRDLESRQASLKTHGGSHENELADITARLSVHRRELRLAQKEIERLGWLVEDLSPLHLVRMDLEATEQVIWPLTDTGFYRAGNG